ncbi:MAG TPA: hypothetical protein VGR16_11820, partial [Thermomicrobiales bacterium]|nr:hypothetical protein [Thermomicrobiales bacterium]
MAHARSLATAVTGHSPRWARNVPARDESGARVEMHGVGQRFKTDAGSLDVLENVDLDIDPGEFRVIVGPSGCGKT